jgi:geranylgeranylglycerol-phosphate geranylgeranyltransferase
MSFLKKNRIFFEMTRPYNLFVPGAVGFCGAILAYGGFPDLDRLLMATLFPAILWAAGQLLNDYLNIQEDSIGKPYLPLPSGRVTRKEVLLVSLTAFLIVMAITAHYSLLGVVFELVFIVGTTLYSAGFKKKGVFGNILFGAMVASCLIIGALISVDKIADLIYLVFISIVVNHSSQNLVGTFKDLEVDAKTCANTVIQVKGIHISILYAFVISTLALIVSLTPWYFGFLKENYVLIPFCAYLFQMRALGLFYHTPSVKNGFEALKMYRTATIPLYLSFTAGLLGFSVMTTGLSALFFTGLAEMLQELITELPVKIKKTG